MTLLTIGSSRSDWQIILTLVLFVIIIFAAYIATYYIAKFQQGTKKHGNMKVVEAIPIGQHRSLQLVKLGDKYVVIGVTKNQINYITTLEEEEITIKSNDGNSPLLFKSVLEKFRHQDPTDDSSFGENQHESKDK